MVVCVFNLALDFRLPQQPLNLVFDKLTLATHAQDITSNAESLRENIFKFGLCGAQQDTNLQQL